MNKGILIWGYFSAFLLLLGAIFTNNDYVAGKVLFLVSFLSFNIGYLLPLFFNIFKQHQENRIGTFLLFGGIGFFIFLTGVSFFIVSWGGGIILIYVGGAILLLAILTLIIFYRRFYETSIYTWFPVLIFSIFIIIGLISSSINRNVMRLFNLNNHTKTLFIENITTQNDSTYNILVSDSVIISNKKTSKYIAELHQSTKDINEYIYVLKVALINRVEGNRYKVFEGERLTNLFHIQSNVEINSGKRFMLKKHKKATELKTKLNHYKKHIISICDSNNIKLNSFIDITLNTDVYNLSNRKYEKNWEYQNFYEFPLLAIINQLTEIQLNIVLCEKEVLNQFYIKSITDKK